jgi:hypothetical protein
MVKKLLVVMAASAVIAFACITILGMIGGFNGGPWGFGPGPWGPWPDGRRDNGPDASRDLAYSGSSRLDIYYPAEITYTQGDQPKFTVTGPQFVLDQLRLEDGELTVDGSGFRRNRNGFRWNGRNYNGGRLRIEITAPNLHEFHLSGAQKLTIKNYDQDELRIEGSGAADIDGEGRARSLDVNISGAGHLDLERLPVDDARVTISGAGDANLDARRSSDVQLSGAGHVDFKCRPADSHGHTSGFGSIDYGSDCSSLPPPAAPAPPASSEAPAAPPPPAAPAKPAPPPAAKSKV